MSFTSYKLGTTTIFGRRPDSRIISLEASVKSWEQRYDDLLEKYHALRLAGGAVPEQPKYEEPVMPPEILMRAIREVSPQQDHAYHMNYQWAMALKDHWTDTGKMREAAQQIRYGSAYTPDMDEE